MPAFSKLSSRIKSDVVWRSRFRDNISSTRRIAQGIPLIHVTSKTGTFADLILVSRGALTVSESSFAPDNPTAKDEASSSLPHSLYFYAGRAYPAAGGVAIAISSSCDKSHTGSATPFDSGGMIRGYIHPISTRTKSERADFIAQSILGLPVWKSRFAAYLAAYFDQPTHYMTEKPNRTDPDGILTDPLNEFRAWVFEVRYYESQAILTDSVICWYAQERHLRSLERLMSALPLSELSFIEALYDRGTPTPNYLSEIEQWVTKEYF